MSEVGASAGADEILVSFRGVQKSYDGENLIVKDLNLDIRKGEFLTLLEGLREHVCEPSLDDFYVFSRACLVKDESLYDRFDQAFGEYFKGVTALPGLDVDLPEDWLRAMAKKHLSAEERAKLEKLGWDKLMDELALCRFQWKLTQQT